MPDYRMTVRFKPFFNSLSLHRCRKIGRTLVQFLVGCAFVLRAEVKLILRRHRFLCVNRNNTAIIKLKPNGPANYSTSCVKYLLFIPIRCAYLSLDG